MYNTGFFGKKITVSVKYIFVLLLLFISGSPGVYGNRFNYLIFMGLILCWIIIQRQGAISLKPILDVFIFALTFFIINIIQFFVLGNVSFLGLANNILKMLIFSFVVFILNGAFKYVYFNILFYLSLVGLFLWLIYLFTGFAMDLTGKDDIFNSIIIWNIRDIEIRNSGPFWEPGAYGGYLMLIPLFFLNEIEFFKKHSFKTFVLILSLLSTLSTTAYLALGIYFGYLAFKSRLKILLVPVFLLLSIVVYSEFSFLKDKLIYEFERAENLDGEYHGQRFAVLLFDLHYIKKHPLIGNGFLETTRYADHPYLIDAFRNHEIDGHGNGFSNFIASMGLITFVIYFLLIYKRNKAYMRRIDLIFYLGMIGLLLNGEQFLYYPLYLGLPFLSLKKFSDENKEDSSAVNCLQQERKNTKLSK